ncbi:unnamed protein product [Protopolystoma xenopodis]|uniref:Uncharacterized protein n=1 Tax=Protopolystoma xenopodis TaxID=117903 RepID=A0A3S5AQH4_9PLAT|nr:unnamed protein product [Protopolystoma xenopodis]
MLISCLGPRMNMNVIDPLRTGVDDTCTEVSSRAAGTPPQPTPVVPPSVIPDAKSAKGSNPVASDLSLQHSSSVHLSGQVAVSGSIEETPTTMPANTSAGIGNLGDSIINASFRTVLTIVSTADDLMHVLGQRTIDAVCQAVRSSLDQLWSLLACREATLALKDVPLGKIVKKGLSAILNYLQDISAIPGWFVFVHLHAWLLSIPQNLQCLTFCY